MANSISKDVLPSTIPIPEDPVNDRSDDCRLWIGNMDSRLTEGTMQRVEVNHTPSNILSIPLMLKTGRQTVFCLMHPARNEPAEALPLHNGVFPRIHIFVDLMLFNITSAIFQPFAMRPRFSMLKLLQKFGTLRRFDFIYHKTGPDKGKSKGYCFVSYDKRQDAERALSLNGKLALSKKLIVKWAHAEKQEEAKVTEVVPVSTMFDTVSPESKIRAIEAKLRSMEDSKDDCTLSFRPAAPPGSSSLSSLNSKTVPKQSSQKYSKKPYQR